MFLCRVVIHSFHCFRLYWPALLNPSPRRIQPIFCRFSCRDREFPVRWPNDLTVSSTARRMWSVMVLSRSSTRESIPMWVQQPDDDCICLTGQLTSERTKCACCDVVVTAGQLFSLWVTQTSRSQLRNDVIQSLWICNRIGFASGCRAMTGVQQAAPATRRQWIAQGFLRNNVFYAGKKWWMREALHWGVIKGQWS